jgi:transposase
MLWVGRLESHLARHWPEVTRLLDLTSVTLLRALVHYGGPAGLAADPEVVQRLAHWGRRKLESMMVQKVIASAAQTAGAPQNARDRQWLRQCATLALAAYRETQQARRQLQKLARNSEILQRQAKIVGAATACVLWSALGDPRDYPCAQAYRKAMGFNLKERSSGKHKGLLKITKRGSSSVRKWLYFAAMRQVKSGPVRRWHEAKKARDKDRGLGSLIAVARKLALALHVVAVKGEPFEPWRLFPGRSLARRNLQASSVEPVGA